MTHAGFGGGTRPHHSRVLQNDAPAVLKGRRGRSLVLRDVKFQKVSAACALKMVTTAWFYENI